MFPVDSLPPQYVEERAAAEAARRLAQQQQEAAVQAQVKAPVATKQAAPSALAQSLQPGLSRPSSSTILGSIFQGFVKRASSTPSPAPSTTPSRAHTPAAQSATCDKEKMEALVAEMRKDTDIICLPSWH